jgi:hypothetical protein
MPIAQNNRCKSPFNAFLINTGLNMIVFGNISIIIKIDKVIACNPTEGDAGSNN